MDNNETFNLMKPTFELGSAEMDKNKQIAEKKKGKNYSDAYAYGRTGTLNYQ